MTGHTHKGLALSTAVAVSIIHFATTQSLVTVIFDTAIIPLLMIPMSSVGGYLPDIDKKNTVAFKWYKKYHWFFYILIVATLFILPWYISLSFLVIFAVFA